MTLYMHAFEPDVSKLMRFASRERLLPPGGDIGYALHAVLAATFGDTAPKPFVWCPPGTRSGGTGGRLLCYTRSSLDVLLHTATSFADPTAVAVMNLASSESKCMPDSFAAGERLGFRVRIRPIVRTGKGRDGTGGKERDAFIESVAAPEHSPGREACYLDWLHERLERGGARLEHGQIDAFALCRLLTRDRSSDKSKRTAPTGPDVTVSGTLSIIDPLHFTELLARGVGRFRAFGFGMLLLAPPNQRAA